MFERLGVDFDRLIQRHVHETPALSQNRHIATAYADSNQLG
jgi:hypothetical protein